MTEALIKLCDAFIMGIGLTFGYHFANFLLSLV
jgi:hypothetical protein